MRAFAFAALAAAVLFGGVVLLFLSERLSRPESGPTVLEGEENGRTIPAAALLGGPLPPGTSDLIVVTLDTSKQPIGDALATLRSGPYSNDVLTDGSGQAVFVGIAGGAYELLVQAPERPKLARPGKIHLADGETKTITLWIGDFDLSISGRVLTQDRTPVPGITVVASRFASEADENTLHVADENTLRAVSDERGFYRIQGLQDGEYTLETLPTEVHPSVSRVARAGVGGVDLIFPIERIVKVYGRVTNWDKEALEGVAVSPLWQKGRDTHTVADGWYSVEVSLGERRTNPVKFHLEGYRNKYVVVDRSQVGDSPVWRLDAELEPAGLTAPVTGMIITEKHLPIAGESVHLHSASLRARLKAESNQDGRFSFPDVGLCEDYRLTIRPKGDQEDLVVYPIEVTWEGLDLEITLEHLARGRISGQIADTQGNPAPRVGLEITNIRALAKPVKVTADDEGRFEADSIPAGTLMCRTTTGSPRLSVRGIELPAGTVHDLRLVIDRGPHEVTGWVTDLDDVPLARAMVELFWYHLQNGMHSSSRRKTRTDKDGGFKFTGVGRGLHKIKVTASKHYTRQLDYEVGAGAPPVTFELQPFGVPFRRR